MYFVWLLVLLFFICFVQRLNIYVGFVNKLYCFLRKNDMKNDSCLEHMNEHEHNTNHPLINIQNTHETC